MSLNSDNKGFTLVELLIAISFFSFLLLFVTFGFVQVPRIFTTGITVKTIQETSRNIVEDVTRTIRTSKGASFTYLDGTDVPSGSNPNEVYRLCYEGIRYGWNQHKQGSTPTSYDPSGEYCRA